MNFRVCPGYHKELEITKLLRKTFEDKSLEEEIDSFKERFSGEENIVNSIFRDLCKIRKEFSTVVLKEDFRYKLFFEPLNVADVTLGDLIVLVVFPIEARKTELPRDTANVIVAYYVQNVGEDPRTEYERLGYANKDVLRRDIVRANLSDSDKFKLLYLLDDFDESVKEFKEYISLYYNFINTHDILFKKMVVRIIDKFKHASGEKFSEFIEKNTSLRLPAEEEIVALPTVVTYNSISFNYYDLDSFEVPVVQIGYLYFELAQLLKKHQNREERFLKAAKIMADPSKFEILKICQIKPAYGQEIAEKLKLTTATVSHHMQQLRAMNYVSVVADTKKVYYQTNSEAIIDDLEILRAILK